MLDLKYIPLNIFIAEFNRSFHIIHINILDPFRPTAALRHPNSNVQKKADRNRTYNKLNGTCNMLYTRVICHGNY